MNETGFVLLVLLFVKHFIVDFVLQNQEQIKSKGIYLEWPGIVHSLQHGFGTFIVFFILLDPLTSLIVAFIDSMLHYHIDWAKVQMNKKHNYTPADKKFWVWFRADQLAHSLTYVWLIWALS